MKKWLLLACFGATSLLSADTKVLAISGSTRADSYNTKLLQEASGIAREMGATVTIVDLKDFPMPFFNEDLEKKKGMPESAKRLRQMMLDSDRFIIASPEYNASLPGELKNAIDWTSRDEKGQGSNLAYKGKKFAIMSASPGGLGGSRALVHLKAVINNLGGIVVENTVSVPNAHDFFDKQGKLTNDQIRQELRAEIQQLLQ